MKRFLILFLCIFTTESFASGIASNSASAPCTNTTLETYSGNSNLAADWQPNTIDIRWYNMNTQVTPTNAIANTCTYDGSLAIPQNAPTRTGYTFAGWTVRPEIDFGTLNLSNGLERWGKDGYSNTLRCGHALVSDSSAAVVECSTDSHFAELETNEWQVKYDNAGKTLYGMGSCSKKPGNSHNMSYLTQYKSDYWEPSDEAIKNYNGNDATNTANNCWCKATGYKANTDAIIHGSLFSLGWVYTIANTNGQYTEEACWKQCARMCSYDALYRHNFRTALFLPVN